MKPAYLSLSLEEIKKRAEELFECLSSCSICPRKCNVNRLKGVNGFCRVKDLPVVSSYNPHFGEESVLVGAFGSGTIFFTSCNMNCVFCQNYEISQLMEGEVISFEDLAKIMLRLHDLGCHNINLVSPTHQVPMIVKSIVIAINKGLKIPIVYNTNAYDSVKTLKLLDGIVDIYMPDAKYSDNRISKKYSYTDDYFIVMKEAIKEMHRQVGDLIVNSQGVAERGLLVRHLVLPGNLSGTEEIIEFISKEISKDTFLNIMDQYHPCYKAYNYPEISRRITREEFLEAISIARKKGLRRLYKE